MKAPNGWMSTKSFHSGAIWRCTFKNFLQKRGEGSLWKLTKSLHPGTIWRPKSKIFLQLTWKFLLEIYKNLFILVHSGQLNLKIFFNQGEGSFCKSIDKILSLWGIWKGFEKVPYKNRQNPSGAIWDLKFEMFSSTKMNVSYRNRQ